MPSQPQPTHEETRLYGGHEVEFKHTGARALNSGRALVSCFCLTCWVEVHPGSTWAEWHARAHAGLKPG